MDRLTKLLVISCLSIVSLLGQQRNTVYQTVATGLVTTSTGNSYPIANNIGQIFHSFAVSAIGTACSANSGIPYGIGGYIQGSYDNTNWFVLNQVVSSLVLQTKIYRATGAYPYIRFTFFAIPTTLNGVINCSLSLFYTGSLTASPLNDASNPNLMITGTVYNSIGTTCTGSNWALSPTAISAGMKLTGYVTGIVSGTPTQMTLYADATCTTAVGVISVPQVVMPDIYNDNLLLNGLGFTTGTLYLYARTNAGVANLIAYLAMSN